MIGCNWRMKRKQYELVNEVIDGNLGVASAEHFRFQKAAFLHRPELPVRMQRARVLQHTKQTDKLFHNSTIDLKPSQFVMVNLLIHLLQRIF